MTKVAISAQGQTLDSPGDPRFGRAAGFLVYDLGTEACDYVSNDQNMSLGQGAGVQTAQNVAAMGASAVITGHVGPKAFAVLQKGGVKIFTDATGSIKDAIAKFNSGELKEAASADVEGHWA